MPASLLWIETDEGISGIAPGGGDIEQFFHLLEGEDPREVIGLWRKMVDYVHKGGLVASGAPIAAIDIALWDLKAKMAQEPLWQTFGALEGHKSVCQWDWLLSAGRRTVRLLPADGRTRCRWGQAQNWARYDC